MSRCIHFTCPDCGWDSNSIDALRAERDALGVRLETAWAGAASDRRRAEAAETQVTALRDALKEAREALAPFTRRAGTVSECSFDCGTCHGCHARAALASIDTALGEP